MRDEGTYDYIIVGAGSAGCVLASRLGEDPHVRILVLEAGGDDNAWIVSMPSALSMPMNTARFNWGMKTEAEPRLDGREVNLPRGKGLGGSSSINGMFFMRGHSADFDGWQALGCEGWSYAHVLPYFKKLESSWRGAVPYHGSEGPMPVTPNATTRLLHAVIACHTQ